MKKQFLSAFAAVLFLSGCAAEPTPTTVATVSQDMPAESVPAQELTFSGNMDYHTEEIPFVSCFETETTIMLSDEGIRVNGGAETDTVFTSHDIIYYEDRDTYDSGNPYGEGEAHERHSAQEAEAHTVVNITAPGTYRVTGKLSTGQIRIDLGENAYYDETAVVELILDNADITCTVAPAILFLNTYECDGEWSADTAAPDVDTSAAGANLILEGQSTVSGSYVARIYKDKEGEKKLWKQDGAIYSYMSLNVFGPGALTLNADNEGLDTELHLTINGGQIAIRSGNDGINTNEDGVSVTTINGGSLHITAGLGEEGDGIDSNGYLVINGGTVVSSANPAADAGLDSDLGSYIHGGTVIALGSTMDWAESDSQQVTMNLQFASYQDAGSAIVVTRQDGTVVFAYDPSEDETLNQDTRHYMGAILSCPGLAVGESVLVYLDGNLTGEETDGVYASVSAYSGGIQMAYTGTDLRGGMGGFGGGMGGAMTPPEGFEGESPEDFPGFGEGGMPEWPDGELPEDFTMPADFDGEAPPEMEPGQMPSLPDGETFPQGEMPEGFQGGMPGGELPEGAVPPEGFDGEIPEGEIPQGGFGGRGDRGQGGQLSGESSTLFLLADKVNAFSGVAAAS